ncbi:60S ribosomal protein L29 [Kwoniella bestiolae CBS 10118]|uniref:60S ribosomal protein L29 n=1 Tax=Kwoniella bestiolae CBS 10118 TaxID=1296100 RepID=A0A1B9FUJ9_9TREE|nr:60S ribosomal protein L29 [Kwoniella bestiolae CBS 10118]OCF22442.1 60S ribosomal protein L29 [Kwoniella bestiolae CBS 10118]
MAKSKNHTAHNQNKKAHKNGIKRQQTVKYKSLKGVDPKVSLCSLDLSDIGFGCGYGDHAEQYGGSSEGWMEALDYLRRGMRIGLQGGFEGWKLDYGQGEGRSISTWYIDGRIKVVRGIESGCLEETAQRDVFRRNARFAAQGSAKAIRESKASA